MNYERSERRQPTHDRTGEGAREGVAPAEPVRREPHPPGLEEQLLEVWRQESLVINDVVKICVEPDVTWVDDASARTRRTQSLTATIGELSRLQGLAEGFLRAWDDTRDLPVELQQAREDTRKGLTAALEAVRRAETQAEVSKGELVGLLRKNTQTQEMLGAYGRR